MAPSDTAGHFRRQHRASTKAVSLEERATPINSAAAERLAALLPDLRAACELLIRPSPAGLDQCAALLEHAVSEMRECQSVLAKARGEPGAIEAAGRVQTALRRATHLLQTANAHFTNWNRILGAMSGGYTALGEPAPFIRPG